MSRSAVLGAAEALERRFVRPVSEDSCTWTVSVSRRKRRPAEGEVLFQFVMFLLVDASL